MQQQGRNKSGISREGVQESGSSHREGPHPRVLVRVTGPRDRSPLKISEHREDPMKEYSLPESLDLIHVGLRTLKSPPSPYQPNPAVPLTSPLRLCNTDSSNKLMFLCLGLTDFSMSSAVFRYVKA